MLALLAALLLSTARAATPEAGVQEDASIAIETPAKVVRHFDGSLRIGYADPLDLGQGSSFMESLAARLEESLRGAGKGGADVSVTLHKYAPFDLQTAVVSHEVDLFLVTSGYYIYLSDMGAGVEWISTLKPPQATDPERAAGSVFVVRADDTRYNQVSDLRTAFVAAAGMASFDGWITALDEVANVSQYPKNFFGKTTFLGASGLSVARAVLERDADVGILRVCELETLTAAGLVEPGSLRVVGEKPQQGLACVSSTELFPGLALAAQTYVPEDVRRRIAAAVYSMPVPESGYRWTLANDYRNVRRVAEKFAYAPTNKASDARFSVVEERYKYALVLGFLILAASMLYSVSVSKIVARRTKALVKVIDEKDALEDHARRDRERLSQLERAGIVSELSSMIAHELRQPVASLINYADGLSLYLGGKGHDPVIDEATREIGRQAERVSSIVERVRSYARQKEGLQREIDFCAVVKSAYSTFRSGAASSSVRVSADLVDAAPVEGDPLELELFVVNTLKNALHALQSGSVEHPEIRLRLKADLSVENNPRWVLEVEDNGLPLDDKKFAELSHPVTSEKFEGLGLGLSICRVIAERHRGRLTFRRAVVSEPGRASGAFVRSRKGRSVWDVTFHGVAAHAGNNPQDGRSAILAAARFTIEVTKLQDLEGKGTSVTVGVIQGGTVCNTVPETCSIRIDTRRWNDEDGREIDEGIEKLAAMNWGEGITVDARRASVSPAMPCTEKTRELVELINEAARLEGFEAGWVDAGGGSDANRIAQAGTPVVDGVAPAGGCFHSEREYLRVDTIENRVRMLSRFLTLL